MKRKTKKKRVLKRSVITPRARKIIKELMEIDSLFLKEAYNRIFRKVLDRFSLATIILYTVFTTGEDLSDADVKEYFY